MNAKFRARKWRPLIALSALAMFHLQHGRPRRPRRKPRRKLPRRA